MTADTRLIVSETRNGAADPYRVFICNDEADFISRIRQESLKTGISDDLNTLEECTQWLNERYAQKTLIITQETYTGFESARVLMRAIELGWETSE